MKPDGVATAAMESTETLEAGPVVEAAPLGEEPQEQVPPPEEKQPAEEKQLAEETAPPAAKEGNSKLAAGKAKPKGQAGGPAKGKANSTGGKAAGAAGPGSRPGTAQNRSAVNGVQKPLANGVAKKATAAATGTEKKKVTMASVAPTKRPVGSATGTPSSSSTPNKMADRKPTGSARPVSAAGANSTSTNGTKAGAGAAQPNKKPAGGTNTARVRPSSAGESTGPAVTRRVLWAGGGANQRDAAAAAVATVAAATAVVAASAPQPSLESAATAAEAGVAAEPVESPASAPETPLLDIAAAEPLQAQAARPPFPSARSTPEEEAPPPPPPPSQPTGAVPEEAVLGQDRPATPPELTADSEGLPPASAGPVPEEHEPGQEEERHVAEVPKPVAAVEPQRPQEEPEPAPAPDFFRSTPKPEEEEEDDDEEEEEDEVEERQVAIEKADEEINDDDDEEEKDGSQPVSVSEMSETQPTEEDEGEEGYAGSGAAPSLPDARERSESRGGGGAAVSEMDSEDVSCSQQGVSELSAPQSDAGLLEGTESIDDLGDASLKGAEGEGASVGSPDIEAVPEIPGNELEEEDEEEEDEEEGDRVCDMEVGSERAEDPRQALKEEEDEDVDMASEGVTESGLESYGNADEDDFAEEERAVDNLLAAQSSSETSTPEELKDYDSSSGVESRSEEKPPEQRPPGGRPEVEQDLGIHLERGDGEDEEEEEAETLPADEVLGDAPTEPASAPSSRSRSAASSEDEASDTEGEAQVGEPDPHGVDNLAFEKVAAAAAAGDTAAALSALEEEAAEEEEEEEASLMGGEGDGDTPQSANSAASYVFDSNAHSTTESCGKSPGIFSLENEDQLPEEIKELNLRAAAGQGDGEAVGPPVDLLPLQEGALELSAPGGGEGEGEQEYLFCEKAGYPQAGGGGVGREASPLPGSPESPASPPPGQEGDPVLPCYAALCEKTDSALAGGGQNEGGHLLRWSPELLGGEQPQPEEQQPQQQRQGGEAPLHWEIPCEETQPACRQEQECKEQQQQQNKTAPVAVLLSPSSALSTIYEAMETTDEEEEGEGVWIRREGAEECGELQAATGKEEDLHSQERPDPQRPLLELDWVNKAEMVQQLINQTLLLAGERCPLLLTGSGGTLSPLESSRWPELLSPLDPPGASITAVTSYSPEDHGCSQGDWTVVELETHH
nr:PREDICTED: proline-rich protein 36 [Lepisosteus oculatus]